MIHWKERPSLEQLRQALAGAKRLHAISGDPLAAEAIETIKAHIAKFVEEEDAQVS